MNSKRISLLDRLRWRHDEGAWDHFVQLYSPLLCHGAGRLGLEGQDAADLVQDIFTIFVQKMPEFSYDHSKRFRGRLWTVTLSCRTVGSRPPRWLVSPFTNVTSKEHWINSRSKPKTPASSSCWSSLGCLANLLARR